MKDLVNDPIIKLIGFVLVISSMWYDLRTKFEVHVATTELRLRSLEDRMPVAKYESPKYALLPSETKLEDEGK